VLAICREGDSRTPQRMQFSVARPWGTDQCSTDRFSRSWSPIVARSRCAW